MEAGKEELKQTRYGYIRASEILQQQGKEGGENSPVGSWGLNDDCGRRVGGSGTK